MKTIRLIVLAALLLPALVSQAQTKEETIAWLKDKLGRYSNLDRNDKNVSNLKFLKITECEITYSYTFFKNEVLIIFPTCGLELTDDLPGICFRTKSLTIRTEREGVIDYSCINLYIIVENREENIYERIQKAIDHLATFCPKAKEAF